MSDEMTYKCTHCKAEYMGPPVAAGACQACLPRLKEAATRLAKCERLVKRQANDPGLWFVATTATENYLQARLRELHAAVEEQRAK